MEITIKDIRKSYGKHCVLRGCGFSASSGTCIGIMGDNGCGKSTLLAVLAGVLEAEGGQFLCNGKDLFSYPKERRRLVGYVPQGTPFMEELSARDNLLLWYDRKNMEQELKEGVLGTLGIDKFLKTQVSKLSGGMKKRLSIACAVAGKPPILLLDEPMSALDLSAKKEIFQYIRQRKKQGGIQILVTHDVMELKLCDVCYRLQDGILIPVELGDPVTELMECL